jgi:hypothetical protein
MTYLSLREELRELSLMLEEFQLNQIATSNLKHWEINSFPSLDQLQD